MIQARKDVNASTKEQKAEEQSVATSTQRIAPTARVVHAVDQRRTAYVTNTLGTPTTVILPEGSTIPESGTLQIRRISLGQPLQHVVTPIQVQGNTSVSESSLPINQRCTVTSTQDLSHILVASTPSTSLHTVELQNSAVNVSASTPQQYQTLGNITNVATGNQRTAGGAVLTQPVAQTSIAQRIVLNSGMSDLYTVRIASTTVAGSNTPQQIVLLDSSANVNPNCSSDVTKVHSYSLASAAGSQSTKIVLSTPTQALPFLQKAAANQPRTSVKRQLITATPPRSDVSPVNNNPMHSHLSIVNKILYDLVPQDGKSSSIPSWPKPPKRIKLEKSPAISKDLLKRRKIVDHLMRKIRLLKDKYYQSQLDFYFLKSGNNMPDVVLWRKKITTTVLDYLKAHRFETHDDEKVITEVLNRLDFPVIWSPLLHSQGQHGDHHMLPKSISHINSSHVQPISYRTSSSPSSQRSVNASPSTPTKAARQLALSPKNALKHNSISSVYDSQIGSKEEIVERAKQEAYVVQRVGELRKEGLWSLKRLPKIAEAPRIKAHYDYLLEEMVWLATDFAQERKWKKATAKKVYYCLDNLPSLLLVIFTWLLSYLSLLTLLKARKQLSINNLIVSGAGHLRFQRFEKSVKPVTF